MWKYDGKGLFSVWTVAKSGFEFSGFFVFWFSWGFFANFFICKACYLIHVSLKTQYNQSHNMNIWLEKHGCYYLPIYINDHYYI